MTDETALTTRPGADVLAQIDALDEQLVIASLAGGLPAVTAKWIYRFPQGGGEVVGLSIDGVQEAARHLATKGEAIEQVWVHMDDQNDREAFFTACAVRYAVSKDGQRIELDRAIRAKRQPKYTKLTAKKAQEKGIDEEFNQFWYEIGVAKALRNAVEALLPEAIKQHMIAFAGKDQGVKQSPANGAAQKQTTRTPRVVESNVRNDILTLTKRLEEETDPAFADKIKTELREAYPGPLSKQSDEDCEAIAARLREALGEGAVV